ncbi:UNVERIFIED_CONTAM: hypothetical protein Scaly_2838200 [Sesamum calycinum]|uniref:Uncharacterized protein n=1 Tax=Sesamum calycinum TaxID=2727403 RepID=A0AAW2IQT4_9LAMI
MGVNESSSSRVGPFLGETVEGWRGDEKPLLEEPYLLPATAVAARRATAAAATADRDPSAGPAAAPPLLLLPPIRRPRSWCCPARRAVHGGFGFGLGLGFGENGDGGKGDGCREGVYHEYVSHHGVKDLPSAIAAADRLDDLRWQTTRNRGMMILEKIMQSSARSSRKKEKAKKVVIETFEPRAVERPRADCFICGNLEHRCGIYSTRSGAVSWMWEAHHKGFDFERMRLEIETEVFYTNTCGVVLLLGLTTMKPTPEGRNCSKSRTSRLGTEGLMKTCTKYYSRVSLAGDVGRLCSFSGSVGKPRAYEDCILNMASSGCVVRHGHHKLYPVHLELLVMTYQSGISNQWETMEARLCRIEKLVGKPEQPHTVGLIQQISVPQETIENLKMRVKEELPQLVQKRRQGCRMRKRCLSRSMYLTGDAKLLWRSRLSNVANANRERIEMWEVLKKELKDQFIPCNTSWIARESLRNLKHTKKAQIELRRQYVKGLPSAIAAAYRLDDFKVANDPEQRNDDSGEGKEEFDKKFKKKEKAKKVVIETFEPRAAHHKCLDFERVRPEIESELSPRSQPPTLGRCRQSPVLPTVCALVCLLAESYCTSDTFYTNHLLAYGQPSTSMRPACRRSPHTGACSPIRPVCLSTVTTDARPAHPPAVQPARTVTRPFLDLAS